MKTILMAASALSLLAAPAAFAQSVSTVNVGGSVGALCGLGNQSGGGVSAPTTNVALGSMIDGNGFLNVGSQEISFGNVWCNNAATVNLTVGALTTGTLNTDPSSFTNTLDMHLAPLSNGKSVLVYLGATEAHTGAPLTNNTAGAFESGVNDYSKAVLSVSLPAGTAGNDRPVAGTYSGSIVLSVSTS